MVEANDETSPAFTSIIPHPDTVTPEESVIADPFLHSAEELSDTVKKAERAADDLWRLTNKCVNSIEMLYAIHDASGLEEPMKAFGCMRSAIASSQDFYETLRYNQATQNARMRRFLQSIDGLRCFVDSSTMNYGITRLPNELLLRILLNAASGVKSTVALSHVCHRFRSMVVGSHEFWEDFLLSSEWGSEQVLTISSRSAPHPIRAVIQCEPHESQALSESAITILSLDSRIRELSLCGFDTQFHGIVLGWHLEHCHFPILESLFSRQAIDLISSSTPSLLQTPSLQVFNTDFVSSSWQARTLTGLVLDDEYGLSLRTLLVFLSSANKLEGLDIRAISIYDHDEVADFPPVFMHHLTTFRITLRQWVADGIDFGVLLVEKIRSSALRTLGACITGDCYDVDEDSIYRFASAYPSIRCLEVAGLRNMDLRQIPQNVEELTFGKSWAWGAPLVYTSGPLGSHHLHLVHFKGLDQLDLEAILILQDLFALYNITVSFEFIGCRGFRNGIFDFDDVKFAFIR